MPVTPLQIRRELARQGVQFQGHLRVLKTDRVVTDGTSLVVKVMSSRLAAENYVADLRAYARAGVPAEQLVVGEPLMVSDQWAVVVRFLAPVEPTQAKHSMAVGKLLRRTHDLVWPFAELREDDEVYCPDDWRPENIVVTADGPVMVDLDLAKAQPRTRALDLAIHDFGKPFGTVVPGPPVGTWSGRNKPHRKDRAWVSGWSPEQIANRLPIDFPDDESMRISHEAIYQALYIEGRGALKRELILCLRTGRALRAPRARSRRKTWAHVTPEALISERPAEVEDRAVPGHWEGDLIIGLERSAIGTLVSSARRATRCWSTSPVRKGGDTRARSRTARPWPATARSR